MPEDPKRIVRAYHERTKHHFQHYAAGPHGLDWANQPDPFRRFLGAELLPLEIDPPINKGNMAPRAPRAMGATSRATDRR